MNKFDGEVLVQVRDLKKHFPITRLISKSSRSGAVRAVDGITLDIHKGETLGLVGESGCGKSTAGRTILHLQTPTSGKVVFNGVDLATLNPREFRSLRPKMQMVFQDVYSSLNPRHSVRKIVAEPLVVHKVSSGKELENRVANLLEMVGLNPSALDRFPHEFSGGQRQRIGIARALALNPEFIVCDEPISALDVSIQAQIVNLFQDLQEQLGLSYLFIAHDLSMVKHISHRVAVMYLGKIVELAEKNEIYNLPLHPYTQSLISAVPIPDPDIERTRTHDVLKGEVPNPSNPPIGCVFNTRCPIATEVCFVDVPKYRTVLPDHFVACHLVTVEG